MHDHGITMAAPEGRILAKVKIHAPARDCVHEIRTGMQQ